jgi:translocation and assembly module TamB
MKDQSKLKRVLVKTFKILGWITLSIIALLIIIVLLIQLPPVQNKITQKAVAFLEEKIGTDVDLESITISFPKSIVVTGFYLEDQKKDTLLYAGRLSIDTDLWALTRHEIQLNDISLENMTANISRPANDSAYNFSYILKAFASDSTAPKKDTVQKPWKFSLENINLEKINARYHDLLTGNNLDLNLGLLEVSMDEFDLEHYKIVVDEIVLKDVRTTILQTKLPEVTEEVAEEKQPFTYDIGVADITLENIFANYTQQALGQVIRLDLGKSTLETDKIDLKLQRIDLEKFSLHNTFIAFQQHPVRRDKDEHYNPEPAVEKKAEKQKEKSKPWNISLDKLDLANNSIQYYDFTKPQTRGAVDFDHLWLSNFNIDARDILFHGNNIKADLENLALREKSGFAIRTFKGNITVTDKAANIDRMLLITNNSRIQIDAQAKYPSLANIADSYPRATLQTELNETSIGWRDILYFNPALANRMNIPRHGRVKIDASLKGSVNNLRINHLVVHALSDTYIRTSGAITGLPDMKKMRMDISLDKFFTTRYDIKNILPDTLIPQSLELPGWLNVQGEYDGSMEKAEFKTLLTSSIGSVGVKGKMNLDSTSATRGYESKIAVNDFHVGKLLKQPEKMGKLNLEASVNGWGLAPKEMNGDVDLMLKSFGFQGYEYKDFRVKGKIKDQIFKGLASMVDDNLNFTIDGEYNFSDDVPRYHFTFDLRNADLQALHFTDRPLKGRGVLDVNMATADFKILNGNLGLRKVAIFNGDKLYAVDSLLFASIDQQGMSELKIDSDILSGEFKGSFNIFALGPKIQEYFGTYYSLHDTVSIDKKDEGRQYFDFKLKLHRTELITDILVPQLTSFVPGEIVGQFDSEAKQLDLRIDISKIQYANIGAKSFLLSTNSDAQMLNYNIMVDEIMIDSLRVDGLEFNGSVANDSIRTNLIILDSMDVHKYLIGVIFHSRPNEKEYELSLLPGQVKLNYVDWVVTPNNYFRFGGAKMQAHNIQLTNGNEKIMIDSRNDAASTLFVGFRELNLEYLVSMVAREKLVSGLLHGDIFIVPDTANMTFTANLGIRDLNYSEVPWGDVSLSVQRKTSDRFDVDLGIKSDRNNVQAEGYYIAGEKTLLDLTATISRFDLATIEPLTGGQLKKVEGLLTGQINIQGSPQQPEIRGDLNLRSMKFFSTYLNSGFSLNNETISLTRDGISFDEFELLDDRKNTARLNGVVATKNYRDFAFRLDLAMDNFRLLNTTEEDNDLFYGRIDINATTKIRGTMLHPVIDTQIGLSDDSHLTYIVPQSKAGVMEQEGIVKFVDRTFSDDPFMQSINPEDTVKSGFTGIDLTARIELTDKETFTVVIDPTTEDQLTVKGNTTLLLEMDQTGDMQLSGRYEISEGTYNLSFYKFLKREFNIEKGSTMTWSGDPLNAMMDIGAVFEVETAPIDLLSAQFSTTDQQTLNRYKQKLPFLVYLNIQGELLKPDITFRLDMEEKERNAHDGIVYAQLLDINTRESDLNKQVFALLILKRFISDNPFENQGATGFEGSARSSVSKILTEQLNRLSENIKGVELSFDVKSYEDYSSGEAQDKTQLQLGLSKNLFNDRLVVRVSGNVDIEGGDTQRQATDYIGDLALEYKLTEDGRFRITGFRTSDYDMIDGELTETGAGLIYVKDYNLLRELFRSNAKKKKK